jgi:hypothetical protein
LRQNKKKKEEEKMSSVKTAFKYNKKVCIIPYEKLSNYISANKNNFDSHLEVNNENERSGIIAKDETGPDGVPSESSTAGPSLDFGLRTLFSDKDQFNNAMGLCYMLNLDPEKNINDRDLLLYTQDHSKACPKDVLHMYHILEVSEVPLSLIRNIKLRNVLSHLRGLREEEEEELEEDKAGQSMSELAENTATSKSSEDLSTNSSGSNSPMRRAWINRLKNQTRHPQKRGAQKRNACEPEHKKGKKKSTSDWINLF